MTNEELIDYINSKIKKNGKKAITGDIINTALIAVIGLIVDAGGVVNWGTIEGTLSDQTDLLAALDAKLNKDGSNADVDVDLGAFAINAKAAKINGTGGNGKLGLKHQSAAATATGSESVLYADSSGLPKWKNDGNTVEQLAYKSEVDGKISSSEKGSANGVAPLNSSSLIDATYLPSYVDDVLEYADLASFPGTGSSGKIYVALDTNLTYRWSGSAYVEISASLAIGETSSTAYRGDRGKTAYDHSQSTGNPHGTTASDVGAVPTSRTINGHDLSVNRIISPHQLFCVKNVANTTTGGTARYSAFQDASNWSSSQATSTNVVPVDTTYFNFYVETSNAQPASGSCVLTIQKNGVDTDIVITIPAGGAAGKYYDNTHTADFVEGASLGIKNVNNASATSCSIVSMSIAAK